MRMIPSLLVLMLILLFFGTRASAQQTGGSTTLNEPQVTQPAQGGVNWKGVGLGAGAVATNLVYVPVKLVYGILGGIVGGAGYALTGGNKQVADSIWRSSLGGDYVLTPDQIAGQKPIYFSGPSEAGQSQASTAGGPQLPSNEIPSTPAASLSPAGAGADVSPPTNPIDSGAGLVGVTSGPRPAPYAGANNPASGYRGSSHNPSPGFMESPLPDTSIE